MANPKTAYSVDSVEAFRTDDGQRHDTYAHAMRHNAGRMLVEQLREDMYRDIEPHDLAQHLVQNRDTYLGILKIWDEYPIRN